MYSYSLQLEDLSITNRFPLSIPLNENSREIKCVFWMYGVCRTINNIIARRFFVQKSRDSCCKFCLVSGRKGTNSFNSQKSVSKLGTVDLAQIRKFSSQFHFRARRSDVRSVGCVLTSKVRLFT